MLPLLRCFFAHLLILQYPDHHQNLISSSLYYSGPVHKISSQSVHNFLSNVVTDKQTDRQTNQRYQNITSFAKEVKMCTSISLGSGHAAVWLENRILVLGGTRSSRAIAVYNLYTEIWRPLVIPDHKTVPPPTELSCAVVIAQDIYIFGGRLVKERRTLLNVLWRITRTPTGSLSFNEIQFFKPIQNT